MACEEVLDGKGEALPPVKNASAYAGLLTAREEMELAKRVERGDLDAKRKLVDSNLRLVVSIAATYRTRGATILPLIHAGTLGLERAAQKFDHRQGFRFSTYATWWIRQSIARALTEEAQTAEPWFEEPDERHSIDELASRLRVRAPDCSFCGKSERMVKQMIAGPGDHICDECVGLCRDILTEAASDE